MRGRIGHFLGLGPSINGMLLLATAKVWHYWISIALVLATIGLFVAVGIGYLVKVVSTKYPKQ